jgi:hypothetical protein
MIKTPKEKEAKRLKDEEKNKKIFDKLTLDFNTVAATPEGIDVFKYIMDRCNYQKNTIVFNSQTGEVNKEASVYLEARRSVYLEIRKYISPRLLKKIEFK